MNHKKAKKHKPTPHHIKHDEEELLREEKAVTRKKPARDLEAEVRAESVRRYDLPTRGIRRKFTGDEERLAFLEAPESEEEVSEHN